MKESFPFPIHYLKFNFTQTIFTLHYLFNSFNFFFFRTMNTGYVYLRGGRDEYNLLYNFADNCLYVKKVVRPNENVEWICYQTVLIKNNDNQNQLKCTARVIIKPDGTLTRNKVGHSKHCDHSCNYQDMVLVNNMKDQCDYVRSNLNSVSHKISALDIFLQEMKK